MKWAVLAVFLCAVALFAAVPRPVMLGVAPHTFWYSVDSMATARPPLPRAVNFADHLA